MNPENNVSSHSSDRPVSPWPTAEEFERAAKYVALVNRDWRRHRVDERMQDAEDLLRAAAQMAQTLENKDDAIRTHVQPLSPRNSSDAPSLPVLPYRWEAHGALVKTALDAATNTGDEVRAVTLASRHNEIVDALLAQMAQTIPQWQAIATAAPKDMTYNLLFSPAHGRVVGAHVAGDVWHLIGVGSVISKSERPTHWMPLPDPPHASETGSV